MKNVRINKKYMAIALRFLKETGLLPFWKEYVIKEINEGKRFQTKHWSMHTYIDQIFGFSNFTTFVKRKIESERNKLNNYASVESTETIDGVEHKVYGERKIIYSFPSVYTLFRVWLTANSSLYGNYTLAGGIPEQYTKRHIIVDTKRRKTTILLNEEEYFEGFCIGQRLVELGQVLKEINALC